MIVTTMVANVGEAAIAGVSLVETINILLINLFIALGTGGAIVVAQYLGMRDTEKSNVAAQQLIVAVLFASVAWGEKRYMNMDRLYDMEREQAQQTG